MIDTIPVHPSRILGKRKRFARIVPIWDVSEDSFITVEAGVSVDANGDPTSTALVAVSAAPGFAHPTDRELREAFDDRQRCAEATAPAKLADPVRLGMSEVELVAAVKGLLQDPPKGTGDPRGELGLTRWVREASGRGLASVEYELWQGRVYRIRWRLAAHFERPVLKELIRRARVCFGAPDYDQKFEAEPSSPKATLQRIGWTHSEIRIELRQLHPLRGGPVYLTVSQNEMLREVGASRVPLFPEPDRSAPWWERSMHALVPVGDEEREKLGSEFLGLLSQFDH